MASSSLLLSPAEDGSHGHDLEQSVLILQPCGEAFFGEVFTTVERLLSGGPVILLNSL